MDHMEKSHSLTYILYLSLKELRHNAWSTFKISLVVAFIILPLILLYSVGLNFLEYAREDMERRFDLKKIRVIVGNPSRQSIKPETIERLLERDDVSFVQPIVTRGVQIRLSDNSLEDFEAVATSEDDPVLARLGIKQKLLDEGNWLIIHERYAKKVYKDPGTREIALIVSSEHGTRQYIIPFRIAATYSRGGGREVYLPLALMDRFDDWRRGYAVPEWNLPGKPDQEKALGLIYSKSVRSYTPYKVRNVEENNLSLAKYDYEFVNREWNPEKGPGQEAERIEDEEVLQGLRITREDNRPMSLHDLQTIQDLLMQAGTANMIAEPEPVIGYVGNEQLTINASTENDPWASSMLVSGTWLQQENTHLLAVFPESFFQEKDVVFPRVIKIKIDNTEIPVHVRGTCRGTTAYAHPRTVYRFSQVHDAKAVFDAKTGKFGPVNRQRSYVAAYIYASKTEKVESLDKYLGEEMGYVTESYGQMIEDIQITEKRINYLIWLLFIAGSIAVVLSIAGTMGEAVHRKRRLIGLMRAMGVLRKGISYFFLFQAFCYGAIGVILACGSQVLITWLLLERQWFYTLLKADPSQHLFWPAPQVWLLFGAVTIVFCIFAGVGPAMNATKFEPGEILSSAE